MTKIRHWFGKYDWGTYKELLYLIGAWSSAAMFVYFLWLIARAICFNL